MRAEPLVTWRKYWQPTLSDSSGRLGKTWKNLLNLAHFQRDFLALSKIAALWQVCVQLIILPCSVSPETFLYVGVTAGSVELLKLDVVCVIARAITWHKRTKSRLGNPYRAETDTYRICDHRQSATLLTGINEHLLLWLLQAIFN